MFLTSVHVSSIAKLFVNLIHLGIVIFEQYHVDKSDQNWWCTPEINRNEYNFVSKTWQNFWDHKNNLFEQWKFGTYVDWDFNGKHRSHLQFLQKPLKKKWKFSMIDFGDVPIYPFWNRMDRPDKYEKNFGISYFVKFQVSVVMPILRKKNVLSFCTST